MEHEDPWKQMTLATAELATLCVGVIERMHGLTAVESERAEAAIRRLAEGSRRLGGQVAETVFDQEADRLRRLRQGAAPMR
jgi:hypothetical protein